MKKTKPEFMIVAGDREYHNGEPCDLVNDKWLWITEEEYRYIVAYLQKKGAIDQYKNRIDGKAETTQHPWVDRENN